MSEMFRVAVMIQPGLFIVLGILVFVRRRMRT
jgi:hypothetical protein